MRSVDKSSQVAAGVVVLVSGHLRLQLISMVSGAISAKQGCVLDNTQVLIIVHSIHIRKFSLVCSGTLMIIAR